MANNIWSNYTEKTATPVDTDEIMARDSTDGKNKRLLFGTFWKWVAKKLNEATISELQTNNKTIIGAINALNSDSHLAISKVIGGGESEEISLIGSMKYAMIVCGDGLYFANNNSAGTKSYVVEIKASTNGLVCYAGSGTMIIIKNNAKDNKIYCFKEL